MARNIEDAASKGVAGAGLGLGIAGTALALLNGRGLFGGGLFGGGGAGAALGAAALADEALEHIPGLSCPTAWQVQMKECDDVLEMAEQRCNDLRSIDKQFFDIEFARQEDRHEDYKENRDRYDYLLEKIGRLECEAKCDKVTNHYERLITNMEIANARKDANFNLWSRTCKMISGQVVLPSGTDVTGSPAIDPGWSPFYGFGNCGCGW